MAEDPIGRKKLATLRMDRVDIEFVSASVSNMQWDSEDPITKPEIKEGVMRFCESMSAWPPVNAPF